MPHLVPATWDAWRAVRGDPSSLAGRQRDRLADLVAFAMARSPFYRKRYAHRSTPAPELRSLPPVTKRELMENFDEWVTDPDVTRDGVERFVADRELIGTRYLGRYVVFATSWTKRAGRRLRLPGSGGRAPVSPAPVAAVPGGIPPGRMPDSFDRRHGRPLHEQRDRWPRPPPVSPSVG